MPCSHQSNGVLKMIHHSLHAKIQYFLAVGETLSFRVAAEQLGISQSAISRSIQMLEEQVGFQLFERSTRKVKFTTAGESLYKEALDTLERLTAACVQARKIASGMCGILNVGYSVFAATGPMTDIAAEFTSLYPEAHVDLRFLVSSELQGALAERSVDAGFVLSNMTTLQENSLLISKQRLIVLISKTHAWADRQSVTVEQIASTTILLAREKTSRGLQIILKQLADKAGATFNFREVADDLPLLLRMVLLNMGCTILDASFIPMLPADIKYLEISNSRDTLDISLVWKDSHLSPLASRFIEIARRHAIPK